MFGDIIDGLLILNDGGQMIKKTFMQLPEKYPGIQIDAFVVMPNHIHGIIIINTDATPTNNNKCLGDNVEIQCIGQPQGVASTDEMRLSLPDVVHRFKSFTTNLYSRGVKEQGWIPFPGRLWQRNYYERIIRDNGEMSAIRKYIENNPYKWSEDKENPKYAHNR